MSSSISRIGIVCLLMGSITGCGAGNDGRLPVNGVVTLKGEALDDGIIEFASLDLKSGASIIKGKYTVPADQGLKPGKYKVTITAGDGRTPADSADGMPGPTGANTVSKDRVPAEYNTNSTQEVTVTDAGPNKFDFTIP